MIKRARLVLALGLVIAAGAVALKPGRSDATPVHLADHIDIRMPEAAEGPVPAVIMLSGCGGVRQVQSDYADIANTQGWAAAIVDSHGARGIGRFGARSQVCTALRMRGQVRAGDVFATVEILRSDARINAENLALAGWSHGGWTVLDALALVEVGDADADALDGVRGAFLLYPYCGTLTKADRNPIGTGLPVRILIAGRDRVVSAGECRRLVADRGGEGSPITAIEEPELTHAFDAADQPWDPRMRFDAEGTARAHDHFAAFLSGLEG